LLSAAAYPQDVVTKPFINGEEKIDAWGVPLQHSRAFSARRHSLRRCRPVVLLKGRLYNCTMPPDSSPPLDAETRDRLKQWLANWARVGPMLDAERWARLRAMTTLEAQEATRRVLELWQPDWRGDDGEELLLHQRVFMRARRAIR
jgi:hypothetical protein